jgi:hypothetical protein
MAEAVAALGLASAIITIVDCGTRIIRRLREFSSDIENVPEAFRHANARLTLLVDILRRIGRQVSDGYMDEVTMDSLRPVVKECWDLVKSLKGKLRNLLPAKYASDWQRRARALRSLAHDTKIQKIDAELERYICLLTLHQATAPSSQPATLSPNLPLVPVFMVPFYRDKSFVGREAVCEEIKLKISKKPSLVVLAGIAGVG